MEIGLLPVLDIVGTIVFALSGALLAVRKDLDIFGVVVLSVAAGLGGGMLRDVLLDAAPPVAIDNELYMLVAIGAGVLGFLFHPRIGRLNQSVRLLDALGLGVFAVVGSMKTLDAGLGPVSAVLLGVLTGVGGGIIRDLLGGEIPLVLRRDIYAFAALIGATACVVILETGLGTELATGVGIGSTLIIRVLAIRYGWQAPRPGGLQPPDQG